MQLSELTLRLLLIFFPGMIAVQIVSSLTNNGKRDFKFFLLYSYLLGLFSYFILKLIVDLNNWFVKLRGLHPTWKVDFFTYLTDGKSSIIFTEIFWSTIVSILLGFLAAAIINHKLLNRLARRLKITRRFAERDVWGYLFESPDVEWIVVRDIQNDLIYDGWVEAFSDTYERNELFLRDVIVYRNSTANELYRLSGLYITRKNNELVIEFYRLGKEETINDGPKEN